jgi:DNA-binding HxlR family transcriptional regulator
VAKTTTLAGHIDDACCQKLLAGGILSAIELVGGRWTGAILLAAVGGARRYGEYRAMVVGISDRLLTLRLKELQAEGLIERTVVPSTPVQILYSPTANARELMSALQPLAEWGRRRLPPERKVTAVTLPRREGGTAALDPPSRDCCGLFSRTTRGFA